jgi:hypothetical protein
MTASIASAYQFISPFLSGPADLPKLRSAVQTLVKQAVTICRLEDCAVIVLDQTGTHGVLLALLRQGEHEEERGEALTTLQLAARLAWLEPLLTGHRPLVCRCWNKSNC